MKVLYVAGTTPSTDTTVTTQLTQTESQLQITTVASAAEALAGVRTSATFHALLTSPTAPQNETLALIATLRRDRVPIAIVPVVTETQQGFFASAVAAGADDVLVLRGESLAQAPETLTRIRQSPHLYPTDERRRLRVLYAGRDSLVWNLLEQVPFVTPERANVTADGVCPVRSPASATGDLRCDAVVIDEHPGDAHPLQVVKSIKAQASDLPVVVLTSPTADDIGTAALDLGADDNVIKTGIYRRRLIATLRRLHQRSEMTSQHVALKAREGRLRQIVESLPEGLTVIDGSGVILAMNAEGLTFFGATRPKEIVGRDFVSLVVAERRADVQALLARICTGDPGELEFDVDGVDGVQRSVELRGVLFERDARDGRGVIGVLRAPAARAVDYPGVDTAPGELDQLKATLDDAEHRFTDLQQTLLAERAEWDEARDKLDARLREAETATGTLDVVERRSAELQQVLLAERAEWDEARQSLESRARDLDGTAAELRRELEARTQASQAEAQARVAGDTMLATVRSEAERAAEAHAADRSAWEARQADLERRMHDTEARRLAAEQELLARLHDSDSALHATRQLLDERATEVQAAAAARADLEGSLSAARADAEHLAERHAVDRGAWESARRQLEGQARDTEGAVEARARVEAALTAARAELQHLSESHAGERASWESTRRQLDARVSEAEAIAHAHGELDVTVRDLRAELEQAHTVLASERASWESGRRQLETRLGEVEAAAHGRTEVETTLAAAHAELKRLSDVHAGERAGWESARHQLESRLAEAESQARLRGELEAALAAARFELAQANDTQAAALRSAGDAHATERVTWDGARRTLEQQLRAAEQAQAEVEASLAVARTELHQAEEGRAAERAGWEKTREQLEHRLHETGSIAEVRARAEAATAALRADLDQAVESHVAERSRWDEMRRTLEAELVAMRGAADSRNELEAALAAVRAELRRAEEAHGSERADWITTRKVLKARLHETQSAADARTEAEAALATARAELRQAADAHAADRAGWEAAQKQLDQDLRAAEARHADERAQWSDAERRFADQLRDLARVSAERHQMEETLGRLRAEHSALIDLQGAERAMRDRDRAELDTLRVAVDEERARRTALEQMVREADSRAHERLAALDAQHRTARHQLDQQLAEATERLARLTEDATAHRSRLEGELARAAANHHRLVESGLFGHSLMTSDGRLVSCNETFARIFGYASAREAIAATSDRPFPGTAGREALDTRLAAERQIVHVESRLERVDRRPVRVVEYASIVNDPAGGPPLVERVFIDMSSAATLEDRLRQARRLEEVGRLAAAIGPDVQALISAIEEDGVRLAADLPADDPRRRSVDSVRARTTQATGLMQQLLAFSRRQLRPPQQIDLNDVIRQAEPMLKGLVGSHIDFRLSLGRADVLTVFEDDLQQLLTTLVVSARDLLPVGGSVLVETARTSSAPDATSDVQGPHLLLGVTAAGYGVQAPARTAALEQVARRCSGLLLVTGDPGRTAAIQVYLPHCR